MLPLLVITKVYKGYFFLRLEKPATYDPDTQCDIPVIDKEIGWVWLFKGRHTNHLISLIPLSTALWYIIA